MPPVMRNFACACKPPVSGKPCVDGERALLIADCDRRDLEPPVLIARYWQVQRDSIGGRIGIPSCGDDLGHPDILLASIFRAQGEIFPKVCVVC